MNKIKCEIIEDMLPLYLEHLASKPTEEMVEEHVCTCENCKRKLEQLKADIMIPMDTEKETIKGIQKKLKRKNVNIAIISGLLVLVLAVLLGVHLGSPILIDNYENAVAVETDSADYVSLKLSKEVAGYHLEETGEGNDIEAVFLLSCWNTKWNQIFGCEEERTISLKDQNISQIYYYSPQTYEAQGDVLLYDSGKESSGAGGVTLPRLVLNAYMLFAGILLLLGIFISVLLRKKDKKHISQKLTLVPGIYLTSSVLVLAGKGDIYNAAYYFSGILFVAIVLYVLVLYVLNHTIWKNKE